MKFGLHAPLLSFAGMLVLSSCITTGEARNEEYAVFRSRSGGYLRVSLDRNRYDANNEPPTAVANGTLSDEEYERILELTSEDLMAHYVETGGEDRQACLEDGAAFSLSTRKSLGGCWVPDQVSDGDTRDMLDFFVPLLEKYVPEPGKEQPDNTDNDGDDKRDASNNRDAGRDAK